MDWLERTLIWANEPWLLDAVIGLVVLATILTALISYRRWHADAARLVNQQLIQLARLERELAEINRQAGNQPAAGPAVPESKTPTQAPASYPPRPTAPPYTEQQLKDLQLKLEQEASNRMQDPTPVLSTPFMEAELARQRQEDQAAREAEVPWTPPPEEKPEKVVPHNLERSVGDLADEAFRHWLDDKRARATPPWELAPQEKKGVRFSRSKAELAKGPLPSGRGAPRSHRFYAHPNSTIDERKADEMRGYAAKGRSYSWIGELFGVSESTVYGICGRRKPHKDEALILHLIELGFSARQIGYQLNISASTVYRVMGPSRHHPVAPEPGDPDGDATDRLAGL